MQVGYKKFYGFLLHLLAFAGLCQAPFFSTASAAEEQKPITLNKLYYGVAYYDEYMPEERLDADITMMKAAGINLVRIAESTWSTLEPQDGQFNFYHIDRVLDKMHAAGIDVIVGTPTYAIPTWVARKYPDVLVTTPQGQIPYGRRQNMDITNKDFRRHAARMIRKLISHVADHPAVIGYQVDNETKHYNTSGDNVQKQFVQWMQKRFPSLDEMNAELGLDYWSNRINDWKDFPNVNGTINASLAGEFARFQRQLVTDYLAWQVSLVKEQGLSHQFVTQNFDFEWRGYSFGIQPDVDHFAASKSMDIAAVDIYHPGQAQLTGAEISFGGDMARSMKPQQNYLVMETQAQGFPQWLPYPGQLRLQAFSHLASGANMVAYWPWHSIHNAVETYWKGLLSHDFQSNPTYEEAKSIGADFQRLSSRLVNVKKQNRAAILFSNEALTAFNLFSFGWGASQNYNDVLRPFYDALYRLNVGVDFVDPSSTNIEDYEFLVVPALYAADEKLLQRLNRYVKSGGHVVYSFKSGFANEHNKVRHSMQPGIIQEAAGIRYSQFVLPERASLAGDAFGVEEKDNQIRYWMELLEPTTAEVLAYYEHPVWNKYAAVTRNQYGKGSVTYIGFMPGDTLLQEILKESLSTADISSANQTLEFPLIVKDGINQQGENLHYYMNYSEESRSFTYPHASGEELIESKPVKRDSTITLPPWGFAIIGEAR